jgi:hypothetical protein
MKKFTVQLVYDQGPQLVSIRQRSYSNGRPSLELLCADENHEDFGFPHSIASVNLPDVDLEPYEILIKDYSENEGMLDFLTENNIVYVTGRVVRSGFVEIPICILRPQSDWGNGIIEPAPDKIDMTTGKKMWLVNGYKVWAESYKKAMELVPLIESC